MAKSKKQNTAATYVRRLAEDDYVQTQLRNAGAGLRQAYERASRRRGKAAEDKKLYDHLRETATGIRRATVALREPPEPPKRRGRRIALAALAGGGAAVVMSETGRAKIKAAFSSKPGSQPSGQGAAAAESPTPSEATTTPG
jgi:ferric-dicitrate binding protein FerR (iron transport regulator)